MSSSPQASPSLLARNKSPVAAEKEHGFMAGDEHAGQSLSTSMKAVQRALSASGKTERGALESDDSETDPIVPKCVHFNVILYFH
jgi:hypothetical protein